MQKILSVVLILCVSLQRQTIRRSGKLLWSPLELFFLPRHHECNILTDIAPTEWRYGNASEINPVDCLTARSRRAFIYMSNNPMKIFRYNGSPVSFQKGDSVMVNATEMAKPFGKLAKDWLSNKSTNEFLASLSAVRRIPLTGLVIVKQGGNSEQGTWMHEDVALEFARWLSPAFAIWCNDRIKELLTTGVATMSNDDEAIAYAMNVLQKRLEQAKADKAMLEQQNALQGEQLRLSAPKVEYYDNCLQSINTLTTTQVAKQIGLDANKLNKKLSAIGLIFRQSGQWILHTPYSAWNLHATRTQTYTRSDGSTGTSVYTVWTQRGVRFIIALHENGWDVKKAIRQIKGE